MKRWSSVRKTHAAQAMCSALACREPSSVDASLFAEVQWIIAYESGGDMRTYQGFTLVELSIVIVIIGLIVGGVLVGRDMIRASELRAQITQVSQFNTAVSSFQAKFGALPGDWRNEDEILGYQTRAHTVGRGDGNGLLDSSVSGYSEYGAGENLMFWRDLSDAGFVKFASTYTDSAPATYTSLKSILPEAGSRSGGRVAVFYHPTIAQHYYIVSRFSEITGGGSYAGTPAYTPEEASQLDEKLDDGVPDSGIVRASDTAPLSVIPATCASTGVDAQYNFSSKGPTCSLIIRVN